MIFDRFFKRKEARALTGDLSYETARGVLEDGREEELRTLAARPDTRPEMLYYLAREGAESVRVNVASNPQTPMQANELLADDEAADVRSELARKIARLLPDMAEQDRDELYGRTVTLLDKLAQDQLPKVRAIVAEEIKRSPHVLSLIHI